MTIPNISATSRASPGQPISASSTDPEQDHPSRRDDDQPEHLIDAEVVQLPQQHGPVLARLLRMRS